MLELALGIPAAAPDVIGAEGPVGVQPVGEAGGSQGKLRHSLKRVAEPTQEYQHIEPARNQILDCVVPSQKGIDLLLKWTGMMCHSTAQGAWPI